MFKRAFMNEFKVRKYARQGGYAGSISSNIHIIGTGTIKRQRAAVYVMTTLMIIMATDNFEVFYEIFGHIKPAYNKALYEQKVPVEVR